jgi:3-hydroxy-9,10-secoandrosta-1,3,5(10)-triene-9,17-dione monooxygenase
MFGNPELTRIHDPYVQHLYGVAAGQADAAEALTLAACALYEEQQRRSVRDGTPLTGAETMKVWSMAREACRLAAQAVEDLFHAVGASGGRSDNRMQRYFRDIEMYRLHIQSQPTFPARRGKMEFGLPVGFLT